MNFKEILSNSQEELIALENIAKQKRPYFSELTEDEYLKLFKVEVQAALLRRNKRCEFIFDESNKNAIQQLYYYLVGSSHFNGDLQKGVLLLGSVGSGKTIIMETFCGLFNAISFQKKIKSIKARELWQTVKGLPEQFKYFEKRPLYIDDIGKEPKMVKNFGNEINPMAELTSLRYDQGAFTFATGNYSLETLKKFYGETITDRMKEMFNIMILPGGSRRK
ncbi:hypothetical protein [Ancylomarina sp. 16SWW S1-10-2]|uniref:hypothetical protein n=1 Tax=Ancylomarina sp. 16SWW S1-10-2 TaxID=2499681 RepID=UPI0012AE7B34|nr:hypothetical protein [Ancylomarina sp. 16SWW S1-10-2]MRT92388.1 hypothetical protein [Ancylomarina sp. 16SWW S1-10-2]